MVFDFEPFQSRHIGPDAEETAAMLKVIGAPSLDALIDEAIPARIRLPKPLNLPDGESEYHFLRELQQTAKKNQVFRSFLGLGYYDTITPSVILRNVENPGGIRRPALPGRDRAGRPNRSSTSRHGARPTAME